MSLMLSRDERLEALEVAHTAISKEPMLVREVQALLADRFTKVQITRSLARGICERLVREGRAIKGEQIAEVGRPQVCSGSLTRSRPVINYKGGAK